MRLHQGNQVGVMDAFAGNPVFLCQGEQDFCSSFILSQKTAAAPELPDIMERITGTNPRPLESTERRNDQVFRTT